MLINFDRKIARKDLSKICPHEKTTHEVVNNSYFEFRIICNVCNAVVTVRGGKLLSISTFIDDMSVTVYGTSTTVRSRDKKILSWIQQPLVKDDFELTEFHDIVARRMVLI
jgi:hypothetical protein